MLRRGWFTLCAGLGMLAAALGGAAMLATSRATPDFYRKAVEETPARETKIRAEQLERQFDQLQQAWEQRTRWQLVLTPDQVNAWLVSAAADKLAQVLPPEASDPRVAIQSSEIRLACRYQSDRLSTVLWMSVEPFLTDEPNVLGLRIKDTRVGWFPVSPAKVLDPIAKAASLWDLDFWWSTKDEPPVALVRLPSDWDDWGDEILVEAVDVEPDGVRVRGTYRPQADHVAAHTAPVRHSATQPVSTASQRNLHR